ncbi:hypothetical protein [Eubacterium barkeri]|uniref:Uncharacterized protein n=1 Tax=Eubacterium barkeri TaxID=1528 RepID=A0A1H3BZ43_EUBBA|nr:hypothetical protein [Eubacterium barkeri]SDX46968.1 hypothetical protein SAMN04488579_102262 [Eubacterium barkeri]
MSMNSVIRQIVSLDKRAVEIQASAIARAEKISVDTQADLKKRESEILSKAKEDSAMNYRIEIEKAQTEKELTIQEMKNNLESARAQYELEKADYARQVLESLLQKVD